MNEREGVIKYRLDHHDNDLASTIDIGQLNAWRSLWMRGGLRKERLRAVRLMAVTIMASALNRAEEIALAAEARAFSPEKARGLPVKNGKYDKAILILSFLSLFSLIWLPR